MTKGEFKRAMQCGLGRCRIELETAKHIGKYRDVVLWGCLHDLSYDAQCEGTRAKYIYSLVSCFEDDDYFEPPVIKAFLKIRPSYEWIFEHFCELLCCFAESGRGDSYRALKLKYEELYKRLMNERRPKKGSNHARDNLNYLCVRLMSLGDIETFLKIAEDIGKLFVEKSEWYSGFDFEYFYTYALEKFGERKLVKRLEHEMKFSASIERFYVEMKKEVVKRIPMVRIPSSLTADVLIESARTNEEMPIGLRWRNTMNPDREEMIKLAQIALEEPDVRSKIAMLQVFFSHSIPFPLNPEPLIVYSKSEDKRLRDTALQVLGSVRNEMVREFALELLRADKDIEYAVYMLISNYEDGDGELLLSALKKLPVGYDKGNWHMIFSEIIKMFDLDVCPNPPYAILNYIYEQTLCSGCRYKAVRIMGRRRLLTDGLLTECLYDSNEDIRNYAKRCMKRRNLV